MASGKWHVAGVAANHLNELRPRKVRWQIAFRCSSFPVSISAKKNVQNLQPGNSLATLGSKKKKNVKK